MIRNDLFHRCKCSISLPPFAQELSSPWLNRVFWMCQCPVYDLAVSERGVVSFNQGSHTHGILRVRYYLFRYYHIL